MATRALFFNFSPIGVGRANTDLTYISLLRRLSEHTEIKICYPESRVSDLIESTRYMMRAMRHRVGLAPQSEEAFLTRTQERILRRSMQSTGWDVFYTNGRVPRSTDLGAVVRFDYIHEPSETQEPSAFLRDVEEKRNTAAHCAVIQVSTEAQKELLRRVGVEEAKLCVVPFFLPDLFAMPEVSVREKQAESKELRIAFVGHEARRKGLEALLEALRDPLLAGLPLKVTIVSRFLDGEVPLPKDPRVRHYAGMRHVDVLRLIAESHILAVPSRRETFGLVYLEGMAAGCVCLMAAGPQQREISGEGICGLPIGPEPKALARAILRLWEEPSYREAVALAGLSRFRDRYAPARVAAGYADMFRRALAAGR